MHSVRVCFFVGLYSDYAISDFLKFGFLDASWVSHSDVLRSCIARSALGMCACVCVSVCVFVVVNPSLH